MIDYQTYCQIRHLFTVEQLGLWQIARALKLGVNTVRKWARRESFQRAPQPQRPSKLDPYKGEILRLLAQHDYTTQQIFQRVQARGFAGRYTILGTFVRQVRPRPRPAFLTLHFEPGQCAQVDWGCAGSVPVGTTRRRLSFFLMVLAFSRKMYLEFTLAETLEHFLAGHQRAFEYFGGVVRQVWVDNQGGRLEPRRRRAGVQPALPGFGQSLWLSNPGLWGRSAPGKGARRERRGLRQTQFPPGFGTGRLSQKGVSPGYGAISA